MSTLTSEAKLIALAVEIIQDERSTIEQSHTNLIGEHKGKITDYDAQRWIRNYDRFLKPARAYLKRRGIIAGGLLRE